MTVGDRIKALRQSKNIPQIELAKKVGVTKQSLYKYEKNIITNIPSDKIQLLADELETTPAFLMGWTEEKEEEYELTDLEKKVLTEFRAADAITRGMVLRALSLDEEEEKRNSKGNSA